MNAYKNYDGFTLIELLISITLLAIIGGLLWGIFARTIKIQEFVDKDEEKYHAMRLAINKIQTELEGAFLKDQNENKNIQFIGKEEGDFDRIIFNTFSHSKFIKDKHESDQNEIEYFIDTDKEGNKVLKRKENAIISDEKEKGDKFSFLSNVAMFDLKYCDGYMGEWKNEWDTTRADFVNKLPIAVAIKIKVALEEEKALEIKGTSLIQWEFEKKRYGQYVMKGCKEED
jgi:general secretion pathway protein J